MSTPANRPVNPPNRLPTNLPPRSRASSFPHRPRAVALVLASILATSIRTFAGQLTLFEGAAPPAVVYAKGGGAPIEKVADLLAHDLRALTGSDPLVTADFKSASGNGVIIGRADSPEIASLLSANRISTAPIDGKWETYGRAVVPAPWNSKVKALLIFGSDTRGTIWGVIDLTREMGVSAWEWWADVKIRQTGHIAVDDAPRYSREPSVKYRAIFLNAGAHGMNPWASKTYDPGTGNMGPKTYAKIFELLWRLKANTIWPAMTKVDTPFNAIPENAKTAADYAIVRGSSHVEMLLRTNSTEWDPKVRGPYNWIVNRDRMIDYWTGAVKQFGKYENLYTVGLRNADDFPMQGVNTPEEMGDVLHDVITQQRKILSTVLGKPADEAPQIFTAYKEILPAYDTGRIQLPDDITITWPDDNFGYIRRLSNAAERRRSGGSGIYYHDTFWGPPMFYVWLQATNPGLMWEEMSKAWHFDARRLWVLNVGSIKPGEFLTQLFLTLAFDVQSFKNPADVRGYLHDWAAGNFGGEQAGKITEILWSYYQLAFERYPEYMGWTEVFPETAVRQTDYNMLAFGDENARRAAAYRKIAGEAADVMAALPDDRKDAFYQLVQYQVNSAANINLRQLDIDKSITYGLQHRASANDYSAKAREAQDRINADTDYYNDEMADGKWRHMVSVSTNTLPIFEEPHLPTWSDNGDSKCGVQVEGGSYFISTGWFTPDLPEFHPELRETRYIDVFALGDIDTDWTATATVPINTFRQEGLDVSKIAPAPWIKLSKSGGHFSIADRHLEDRILVSIDWDKAPANGAGEVILTGPAFLQPVAVHIHIARPDPAKDVSFIEADRIVSIYATHTDTRSDGWEELDGFGHTGATLRTPLDMKSIDPADGPAVNHAPSAVYRFATTTTADKATLSAVAIPTFPITSKNGVRVVVSIDGGPSQLLDFYAPEFSEAWRQHALTNKAIERIGNLSLAPGAHTLTVRALDPGVTLDWFEIAFDGAQRSYGPPPETRIHR